jgi:hypothetical protein
MAILMELKTQECIYIHSGLHELQQVCLTVDIVLLYRPLCVGALSSSSMWGRQLPTECTAAFRDLLY